MARTLKTALVGLAALALAGGGLTACSSSSGNVKACESFDAVVGSEEAVEDDNAAAAFVLNGANEAAGMASSETLAENFQLFGKGFSSMMGGVDVGDVDFFQVTISLKEIVAECEAAGAEIPNLQEFVTEAGLDGLTVEDLEELRDWEENFGDIEEETAIEEGEGAGGGGSFDPEDQSFDYDFELMDEELEANPALFEPWNACWDGDMGACDVLYERAPAGSEMQKFGAECGGFKVGGTGGTCAG